MSRHALPRPVRGPFPVAGPDGAYIILSSSRSCDVLIELYGSGLVVWTLQFPRTIKDETPLRSHNLCMLRRWRRWRRDWRSSNRRLSIASDLLSLFCPLLGTHTSLYLLPPKTKKKSQKKAVEILLSDCGLSTVLQAHVVAVDAAASQVGRPRADHSSTGVQKAAKERRGMWQGARAWRAFGTEKVLGRKTSFKLKYFSPLASLSLYMALNFAVRETHTHTQTHRNTHTHSRTHGTHSSDITHHISHHISSQMTLNGNY